ncbi:MAG: hypothetical protein ED557_05990 [Balneola sp.]|nr:MAG: hypothetical protein ED557_05990 [Balneola sp.]
MNVSYELIIPPVILGILIMMVVSSNVLLVNSSVENQSTYHIQSNANNAVMLIQEEIKYLQRIKTANGSVLEFVEKTSDTSDSTDVRIYKQNEYLIIERTPDGGSITTQDYFLRLNSITFEETVHGTTSAPFLKVVVETITSSSEQVDPDRQFKASAELSIYLKNLHVSGIFYTDGS